MIEQGFYDLDVMSPHRQRIIDFTRIDDPRWSGIVELPPECSFETAPNQRTDIYVLQGATISGGQDAMKAGDFLSLCENTTLTAAGDGAVLLVYREPAAERHARHRVIVEERAWRPARPAGMRIADLTPSGYQLSLVEWGSGSHVTPHDHLSGEEIFILDGELRSQGQSLRAGSWMRLHAGSPHAPCAEHFALIILRNGHMRAAYEKR